MECVGLIVKDVDVQKRRFIVQEAGFHPPCGPRNVCVSIRATRMYIYCSTSKGSKDQRKSTNIYLPLSIFL